MENEKLKRQYLIELEKKFDSFSIETNIGSIIQYMEELIKKFQYEIDERFYTFGRRNIVINEFSNNVLEKNLKGAYGNLQDIIHCNDFIPLNAREEIIANGLDYNKVQDDMNSYKNDGYICLQEKNIIMDMIDKLKTIIGKETNMEFKFYLIGEKRLLCTVEKNTFELIDGKWTTTSINEINDRLIGYDPYEEDPAWGIGNSDVMSTIKEITREQAIEFAGENVINDLKC